MSQGDIRCACQPKSQTNTSMYLISAVARGRIYFFEKNIDGAKPEVNITMRKIQKPNEPVK
jgi:hypothetical protein